MTWKEKINYNALGEIIGIVTFIIAFVVAKQYFLPLGIVIGVWYLGYWLGTKLAQWCIEKNPKFIEFVNWSNLFTWIIPPLGFMTFRASLIFSKKLSTNRQRNQILAIICLGFLIINSLYIFGRYFY